MLVSPVLGLAQSGFQIAADRYSYLACIPWAALAAVGLADLAQDVGRCVHEIAGFLVDDCQLELDADGRPDVLGECDVHG